MDRDFGTGDGLGDSSAAGSTPVLAASGALSLSGGRVGMLCYPRHPRIRLQSDERVYFCRRCVRRRSDRGALPGVNNTFGDRHCYLIARGVRWPARRCAMPAPRPLYVSPFIGMDANYRFQILPTSFVPKDAERLVAMAIDETRSATGRCSLQAATVAAPRRAQTTA